MTLMFRDRSLRACSSSADQALIDSEVADEFIDSNAATLRVAPESARR